MPPFDHRPAPIFSEEATLGGRACRGWSGDSAEQSQSRGSTFPDLGRHSDRPSDFSGWAGVTDLPIFLFLVFGRIGANLDGPVGRVERRRKLPTLGSKKRTPVVHCCACCAQFFHECTRMDTDSWGGNGRRVLSGAGLKKRTPRVGLRLRSGTGPSVRFRDSPQIWLLAGGEWVHKKCGLRRDCGTKPILFK